MKKQMEIHWVICCVMSIGTMGALSCASQSKSNLADLKQELTKTQTDLQDTNKKLATLSQKLFLLIDKVESNQVEISRYGVPKKLQIVKLYPHGGGQSIKEKPTNRSIVMQSNIRQPSNAKSESDEQSSSHAFVNKAQGMFEDGKKQYRAKKFKKALSILSKFMSSYGNHEYADNALLLMARSNYAIEDNQQAIHNLMELIEIHPDGNKVPEALFLLHKCYRRAQKHEDALLTLKELVATYPRSDAAKEAKTILQQIDPTGGM